MQNMLYLEAYKVLGDAFEAEDAVQNMYVRLWEQKEELGHIVSPEAYCRTMLKHICIDRWRRMRARAEDVELIEEIVDANAPPDAEREETAEFLEHFLTTLPEMQRRVMRMQMQGSSPEEIAKATGLTEGNIKVIVSRIRKRFKELYYKR
mgnify:FL=1